MAWHYNSENLPSSLVAVEASWEGTCLDGAPSALLSLLPTREASCLHGNGTGCSQPSPCGMTSEPLTASHGAEALMLSAEASRVKTSASPERVTDLTESEADCGPKWPGSLARYNPGSRSWRTAQCSLLGDLTEFSETFPRWGMMRSGELFQQPTPVLRTSESVFGSLPTPTVIDATMTAKGKAGASGHHSVQLSHLANSGALMTVDPIATQDNLRRAGKLSKAEANTPSGNWPTPTCSDAFTDKLKSSQQQEGSMHSVNLSQAVKMFPTPTATDYKGAYTKESMVSSGGIDRAGLLRNVGHMDNPDYKAAVGGQLNPDWVEWLMNWPIGWTSMEPLNRDRFLAWLRASPSVPTASSASVTDKYQQPQCLHGQPSTNG